MAIFEDSTILVFQLENNEVDLGFYDKIKKFDQKYNIKRSSSKIKSHQKKSDNIDYQSYYD